MAIEKLGLLLHKHRGTLKCFSYYFAFFNLLATPPPPIEHLPGFCPPEMAPFGDSCYYVPKAFIHADWSSARWDCQKMGADLASIHSKSENEFIKDLVYGIAGVRTTWLGLERYSTGNLIITQNHGRI